MILKKFLLLLNLILIGHLSFSQEKFTISGTITDKNNNETLIGVSININATNYSTITNEYGFYSFNNSER